MSYLDLSRNDEESFNKLLSPDPDPDDLRGGRATDAKSLCKNIYQQNSVFSALPSRRLNKALRQMSDNANGFLSSANRPTTKSVFNQCTRTRLANQMLSTFYMRVVCMFAYACVCM